MIGWGTNYMIFLHSTNSACKNIEIKLLKNQ